MALLTEELRSWIGREAHYPAREELGRALIRYFALAMARDKVAADDSDMAGLGVRRDAELVPHRIRVHDVRDGDRIALAAQLLHPSLTTEAEGRLVNVQELRISIS